MTRHGTHRAYQDGCRCEECQEFRRAWYRRWCYDHGLRTSPDIAPAAEVAAVKEHLRRVAVEAVERHGGNQRAALRELVERDVPGLAGGVWTRSSLSRVWRDHHGLGTTEAGLAAERERYRMRRARGQCTSCGRRTSTGASRCRRCAQGRLGA